jgi:hypothetical protein
VELVAAEIVPEVVVAPEPLDDLAVPLVPLVKPIKKEEPKKKPKQVVVVRTPEEIAADEEREAAKHTKTQKGKELVFDENAGRVVVKRTRKANRARNEWDEEDDF